MSPHKKAILDRGNEVPKHNLWGLEPSVKSAYQFGSILSLKQMKEHIICFENYYLATTVYVIVDSLESKNRENKIGDFFSFNGLSSYMYNST